MTKISKVISLPTLLALTLVVHVETSTSPILYAAEYPDFIKIYEENKDSVVTVVVKKKAPMVKVGEEPNENFPEISENGPLKDFFEKHFGNGFISKQLKSTGTGLILSTDGKIVTSAHLLKDAIKITVFLKKNKKYNAKPIKINHKLDLALLEIKATNLREATLGSSKSLKVGSWVLTIGAPFGFQKSASQGIISGLKRRLTKENKINYIQTDVAVNPGNSGGPLFNSSGEVVGLISQIFSNSGGYQGVSFALPIEIINSAFR